MLKFSQNQALVEEGAVALVFDRSLAVLDRAEDRGIILNPVTYFQQEA